MLLVVFNALFLQTVPVLGAAGPISAVSTAYVSASSGGSYVGGTAPCNCQNGGSSSYSYAGSSGGSSSYSYAGSSGYSGYSYYGSSEAAGSSYSGSSGYSYSGSGESSYASGSASNGYSYSYGSGEELGYSDSGSGGSASSEYSYSSYEYNYKYQYKYKYSYEYEDGTVVPGITVDGKTVPAKKPTKKATKKPTPKKATTKKPTPKKAPAKPTPKTKYVSCSTADSGSAKFIGKGLQCDATDGWKSTRYAPTPFTSAKSAGACKLACMRSWSCNGYTFDKECNPMDKATSKQPHRCGGSYKPEITLPGYKHVPKKCVSCAQIATIKNLGLLKCKNECGRYKECKAFHLGVAYGGKGKTGVNDCVLKSSNEDYERCDGENGNVDLYIKQ